MNRFSFEHCPKCGMASLKPDSPKSIACTSCGFVYFFNAAAAVVAIILNEKNELLMTVRASDPGKGLMDFPGGFVDPGESAEDALRREIKEELNLDIESMTYFCTVPNEYVYKQVTYITVDIAFICKVSNFSKLEALDDIDAVIWLPMDKYASEQLAFASTHTILSRLKTH